MDEYQEEIQIEADSDGEQPEEFESAAESSFDTTLLGDDQDLNEGGSNRRSKRVNKDVPLLRYRDVSGAAVHLADEPNSYNEAISGVERDQ